MNWHPSTLAAIIAAMALTGCVNAASDADYSQQRGISADITGTLNKGPTASKPGMEGVQEPIGALPWESSSSR
jgi:hypothetical protein